jgi:hypothetical protein
VRLPANGECEEELYACGFRRMACVVDVLLIRGFTGDGTGAAGALAK